jgi:hypothetical protein
MRALLERASGADSEQVGEEGVAPAVERRQQPDRHVLPFRQDESRRRRDRLLDDDGRALVSLDRLHRRCAAARAIRRK